MAKFDVTKPEVQAAIIAAVAQVHGQAMQGSRPLADPKQELAFWELEMQAIAIHAKKLWLDLAAE